MYAGATGELSVGRSGLVATAGVTYSLTLTATSANGSSAAGSSSLTLTSASACSDAAAQLTAILHVLFLSIVMSMFF